MIRITLSRPQISSPKTSQSGDRTLSLWQLRPLLVREANRRTEEDSNGILEPESKRSCGVQYWGPDRTSADDSTQKPQQVFRNRCCTGTRSLRWNRPLLRSRTTPITVHDICICTYVRLLRTPHHLVRHLGNAHLSRGSKQSKGDDWTAHRDLF